MWSSLSGILRGGRMKFFRPPPHAHLLVENVGPAHSGRKLLSEISDCGVVWVGRGELLYGVPKLPATIPFRWHWCGGLPGTVVVFLCRVLGSQVRACLRWVFAVVVAFSHFNCLFLAFWSRDVFWCCKRVV